MFKHPNNIARFVGAPGVARKLPIWSANLLTTSQGGRPSPDNAASAIASGRKPELCSQQAGLDGPEAHSGPVRRRKHDRPADDLFALFVDSAEFTLPQ
jgi:hypothetical protein